MSMSFEAKNNSLGLPSSITAFGRQFACRFGASLIYLAILEFSAPSILKTYVVMLVLRYSLDMVHLPGKQTVLSDVLLCLNPPPPTVWPHLFRGACHEIRRGEQLKWSLAFRLYIGSFPCAQLPGLVHTARLGRVFFCVFSLGLCFVCSFVLFDLLFLLCFLGQLCHLPYSSWRSCITNLNEPPRALATSTIMWVRS